MNNNLKQIKNSLEIMHKIFHGYKDYRVIGSVLVAAINGKPHRELHDIDLLIDKNIYKEICERFRQYGFTKVTKHAGSFTWDEFQKQNYLTFGVLLRGTFTENFFYYQANPYLTLSIKTQYLQPTVYELFGAQIRGIPLKSVFEGIKIANFNIKRRIDKEIVAKKLENSPTTGLSINQAFKVKVGGITIPYLYTLFSYVYNLIGGIRLVMGKSYDPWK